MTWSIFQWRSLKTRVTLFTLAIFVIAIWSLAIYASRMLHEDMQRVSGEQQFSTVSFMAAEIDGELKELIGVLEAVAATVSPSILGNAAASQAFLEQRLILQNLFNGGVFITQSDGTATASLPLSAGRLGVNFGDRDYVVGAIKHGKATIGKPIMGLYIKSPLFVMAVPIRDAQGNVIGALNGVTDLGKPNFLDKVSQSRYGKTGGFLLVAPQHRLIVTATDKSRAMETSPPPGTYQLIDRFMRGYEGSGVDVYPRGVEVLASAKGIPVAGWYLNLALSTEEAFAPIHHMQQRVLFATLFLTLLAGVLTWWMLRHQLAPMLAAAKALATQSDTNQPPHPLSISRRDEIGELIAGFNRLLLTLAQHEEALRESENRSRAIIEASPVPLAINDEHGNITFLNRAFVQAIGYTDSDIPTLADWWPRAYPDLQYRQWVTDNWAQRLDEATRAGRPFAPMEIDIRCKDGSVRTFIVSAAFLKEMSGGPHLVSLYDVTERKRAEAAVSKAAQRLQIALDGSQISVWETDLRTGEIWLDAAWAAYLGEPAGETRTTASELLTLVHPEDRQRVTAAAVQTMKGEISGYTIEHRVKSAGGEWKWIQSLGRVIECDAAGRPLRMSGTNTDITERKQREEELRRFRLAMDASADGIYLVDRASMRFTDINASACSMLGLTREEIFAAGPEGVLSTSREALAQLYDAVIADGATAPIEMLRTRSNGRQAWVEIRRRAQRSGEGWTIVTVARDITERKYAERYEQFRSHTLELLAGAAPLSGILEALVRGVEQLNPAMLCSILLLDSEGRHLRKAVAPSLPDFYNAALQGIEIGMGVGSCGTAAFTGERVIVDDIATHPYWVSYKELAASAGLGACWSQPIRSLSGRVLGTFAIYHHQVHTPAESDICLIEQAAHLASIAIERNQAEAELRIAAAAFDSRESMMVTDPNRVILRVNKAFTELTGYTPKEVVGQTPRLLQSGRYNADFYRTMQETIQRTGGWQGEIWDRGKNGEEYPTWLAVSAVKDDKGAVTHFIGAQYDIAAHKRAEEKINELAFFDQLTGLPNRTLLLDRVKQAMTASSRDGSFGALLLIDLDKFKTLNDTLGHDMGDLLLKQVAQRLTKSVRAGDTVARLGGDEFALMLASLSTSERDAATQTEAVGKKLLTVLNQAYQLKDSEYHCSPSIGATLFTGHRTEFEDLLKQADLAMYRSKEGGRNALHFFDPDMEIVVMKRAALEKDLREAVQEKKFLLHYQAQVVSGGRVTGAEALVRWQHPQRGLVSPADFIPLAEDTGLILPLGQWVLETACTQLVTWAARPEMAHLTLAVNVSAHQFRQPGFVDQVLAILKRTGANPNRLKLELTETMMVEKVEDIIEKMHALKARGVGFSLDDFGTGYSSLAYLKRLPLDQLKIDRSFVSDVLTDANDAAIARTIVALAQNLGLGVIAEGVETEAQRDFLAGSGCHAYQGYFFSRPLPIDEFERFAQRMASNSGENRFDARPVTA